MPSILWKRLDRAGHEFCSLDGTRLTGIAAIEHEGSPCGLAYEVVCDDSWRTRSTRVTGSVGGTVVDVDVVVSVDGTWTLNGEKITEVAGCLDVDLNFSPSTNTLPIRRLKPEVGEEVEVRAAWLTFPDFELEGIEQTYRRLDELTYQYSGGKFTAEVRVTAAGLATTYEGFCQEEAMTG